MADRTREINELRRRQADIDLMGRVVAEGKTADEEAALAAELGVSVESVRPFAESMRRLYELLTAGKVPGGTAGEMTAITLRGVLAIVQELHKAPARPLGPAGRPPTA